MHMTFPTMVYANSGETKSLSLQTFLTGCDKALSGLPWRLRSCRFEIVVSDSTRTTGLAPVLCQLSLSSGQKVNAEGLVSARMLVHAIPRVRYLRMINPNPWHEDEERAQEVISITNFSNTQSVPGVLTCYVNATFQFRPLVFQPTNGPSPAVDSCGSRSSSVGSDWHVEGPAVCEDRLVSLITERVVRELTAPDSPILRAIRGLQLEPRSAGQPPDGGPT